MSLRPKKEGRPEIPDGRQCFAKEGDIMFADFFYLLRKRGLNISLNEWLSLIDALNMGLSYSSLTEFYYLSRAVLIKTEADFDKFDLVFAEYFKGVQVFDEIPEEVMSWLNQVKETGFFDKHEVDARTAFDLEKLKEMFEERLKEQKGKHDGGKYWIGTGGTSVLGHSGYSATGIRVGGEGKNRRALQVAGERIFRDFRDDDTLDMRQFQTAFRRLRQFSSKQDGPRDELDLEDTIKETCNNAGNLKLVFDRPRVNTVKLMILFDSGGSMWPYANLCNLLFQSVSKSNHFKDLKIYYFHNCFYDKLFLASGCNYSESIDTDWVLRNLGGEYKVITVGDAAMAPSELLSVGGSSYYNSYNEEPGIEWIKRFTKKYEKMIWLNPLPESDWEYGYGYRTIQLVKNEMPMFRLTVKGLTEGLKYLIAAR